MLHTSQPESRPLTPKLFVEHERDQAAPTPQRARLAPSTPTIVVAAPAGKGCVGDDDTLFQEQSMCSVTAKPARTTRSFLPWRHASPSARTS